VKLVHLVGFIIKKLAFEITRYHVPWLRRGMVALRRPWSTRKKSQTWELLQRVIQSADRIRGDCDMFRRLRVLNHLTPNGHYMGRTLQLTSRCCILYIYSTNIRTEYFKHAA